ncbi:MAG: hypothetical protein A2017_11445 [Lentisphaerae bacterium GWF2_44_16]|nr:MAG: hypothetical protein A2017_11445 [Lentisphaerae bacterium GWF2_44_16]
MTEKEFCGFHKLISEYPDFEGENSFPLPAYSEFMPPPRLGITPSGNFYSELFAPDDPYGWQISEIEEEYELKPGMAHIGLRIMEQLINLGNGKPVYNIYGQAKQNITENPYWPPELAENAGKLEHERYIVLLPLSLSRTQDDKGRVHWTLFGGSEQGPEKAFWKSFYSNPGTERPEEDALSFFSLLFKTAYGKTISDFSQLYEEGFRILPTEESSVLPSWAEQFKISDASFFGNLSYILTFRPFSRLPGSLKKLYLGGKIALLPFPGSLIFWGTLPYTKLSREMPMANQIPLLRLLSRRCGSRGIRIPQSGWLSEPHPDLKHSEIQKELVIDTYHRIHRYNRVPRYMDELLADSRADKVAKVLFSTNLETIGLYDKPMARNCQLWTKNYEMILNGPIASSSEIQKAEKILLEGGLFGYRFIFPAMHVGRYEIYWQRPLTACLSQETGKIEIMPAALSGYMTAYETKSQNISNPVELWPRMRQRDIYFSALRDFESSHDHYTHQTALNIISMFNVKKALGMDVLPRSFTRHLLRVSKNESLEKWLASLSEKSSSPEKAARIQEELNKIIAPEEDNSFPSAITYNFTASRTFEETWWNDIRYLAHGKYINKDNADCVKDDVTLSALQHHHRDLELLGDYLISRHQNAIDGAGMRNRALCGELPFKWQTDFSFDGFGGWLHNHKGNGYERDILVVIPGKDRTQAVVMADHYDTAFMEDIYDKSRGGTGARLSAAGADDNHSATSTLLQAAPVFLKLASEGRLEKDVWLLHLTGEEFPSDCMGARHFCQALIEKRLKLYSGGNVCMDLSNTSISAVLVMDMIAHNRDSDQDIFQISPGKSPDALRIALEAHTANMIWNAGTHLWNRGPERHGRGRGKRNTDDLNIPETALHLPLLGEVRTHNNPRSSLYNTDGQIFSDMGIPVVLFMENYDINRSGYHDTKDTMHNIDLDYGAAVAAIAIETAARLACSNTV